MNRRKFLQSSASLAAVGALRPDTGATQHSGASAALNPPGIRTAGIRMLPVAGGKYKVWTKRMGTGKTKVLLLHGGPAFTHNYLEAMESFLPDACIEMYYYDQLGCGNSDIPDDASLWTLERFTEEVEEVRLGLGLEKFVLYGHSWGGILAMEYALNYQQHLRGLVISNMTAGTQAYLKRTTHLKHTLLNAQQLAQIEAIDASKDYDNPIYDHLMEEVVYPQMICRLKPWPEPLSRAVRLANHKIYEQMQGRSEFLVTGNLKDWERWDRLHDIRVRTLVIGGAYDEMDPDDLVKMATLMPNATSHICPNGSHLPLWDDQQDYFRTLVPFLKSV